MALGSIDALFLYEKTLISCFSTWMGYANVSLHCVHCIEDFLGSFFYAWCLGNSAIRAICRPGIEP